MIVGRTALGRTFRHSSFVILFGILCLLFPAKGFGQSSNRWLLVYNTSSAMRDRAKGMLAITEDLLTTAMHGNMRNGDTIGIWTFNNRLRADEAPLQTWNPATAQSTAQNTLEFLTRHHYENSAAFDDVLTNMYRVIKMSDFITVILISDGNDSIKGTPFDARLDAFYKTNSKPQKKAHMPVVTVFRGVNGVITTNTLSLAPWPVDVPLVPPPVIAKVVPPKPAPPVPPPAVVPSLVIIGKKSERVLTVPTDLPDHSGEPASSPLPVEQKPVINNVDASAPTPGPAATPAIVPEEKSKPAAAPAASVQPTSPVAPVVETPKPIQPPQAVTVRVTESNQPPVVTVSVVTAPTVPTQGLFSARNIAIVSVTFTVLVCGLLFLSARNSQSRNRASLITRSLDRENK